MKTILFFLLFFYSLADAQETPMLFKHPLTRINPGKHSLESHIGDVDADLVKSNPSHILINLPNKVHSVIKRESYQQRGPKNMVWRGKNITLTQFEDLILGRIEHDNEIFNIYTNNNKQIILEKIDSNSFPPEWGHNDNTKGKDLIPPQLDNSNIQPTPDTQVTVTVMSVYTPQAREFSGGTTQIQAVIQTAVDQANTALLNSNMNFQFQLVHMEEVTHNDSGNISSDLTWVAFDPIVASLRDTHAADLVSLIVDNGGGYCGIGYIQRYPEPSFASSAFQVTARGCIANLTWAHEHGHNLGMEHDPPNGSATPSYPWSYGHNVAGQFRTIMSYACPSPCPRILNYSNPSILYNGLPTGIPDQRDNARTGNLVAPIAANFRVSTSPLIPAPSNLIVQ